jgi:hypothetical protein
MTKRLRITQRIPDSMDVRVLGDGCVRIATITGRVDLVPEQWLALVAAVEVVDVPTPGQRLFWAELECGVRSGVLWDELSIYQRGAYEQVAARLGITEGE